MTDICNLRMIKRNSRGCNLKEVMENVEYDCIILFELFRDNSLTLNADKCHILAARSKNETTFAKVVHATTSAPEINISPVPYSVSGSRHYVPVTYNLCRSSVL